MQEAHRLAKLEPPGRGRTVSMVLDTDTFNEVDDQFAVAYAVRAAQAGELKLEAVYAAPFSNQMGTTPQLGMELSYQEILKVMDRLHCPEWGRLVYRGSGYKMDSGELHDSPAVRDLICRAMDRSEDDPLYLVSIGAATNVASALRIEPRIADRLVLVWLGGNALHWPHVKEYNVCQDITAAQTVLDSGIPLVLMPAYNVVAIMNTTIFELEHYLDGKSDIGTYLTQIVREYAARAEQGTAWSKVIWDVVGVAYLLHPEWVQTSLAHTPILTDDLHWAHDQTRPLMRIAEFVRRDPIFMDVFQKLAQS